MPEDWAPWAVSCYELERYLKVENNDSHKYPLLPFDQFLFYFIFYTSRPKQGLKPLQVKGYKEENIDMQKLSGAEGRK